MVQEKTMGLEYLNPERIERNPENPRLIFDEKLMQELTDSINEIGILVPLIVFYDEEKKKFVLLDGERRWKCSLKLRLEEVPVNIIAKPTRLQNILEMFNIHNVRMEWGPMEVAWKLEVIIKDFGYSRESELARLTSLNQSEIRKSKILLSYDKKYQDMVHDGPRRGGIKEDFLIELTPSLNWLEKNFKLSKQQKNSLIDSLIKKHKRRIIDNYVKGFRNLSKIVKSELPKEKLKSIIKNLSMNPDYTIDDAYEVSIKNVVSINDLERKVRRLIEQLSEFQIIWELKESKKLLSALNDLKDTINKIIGKR